MRASREWTAAGPDGLAAAGHNRRWGSPAKGQVYTEGDFPLSFVRIVERWLVKAMGIPLRGAAISPNTNPDSTQVMLINETLAARLGRARTPSEKLFKGTAPKGKWSE